MLSFINAMKIVASVILNGEEEEEEERMGKVYSHDARYRKQTMIKIIAKNAECHCH